MSVINDVSEHLRRNATSFSQKNYNFYDNLYQYKLRRVNFEYLHFSFHIYILEDITNECIPIKIYRFRAFIRGWGKLQKKISLKIQVLETNIASINNNNLN